MDFFQSQWPNRGDLEKWSRNSQVASESLRVVGVGRFLKDHQDPIPSHGQGHLSLDWDAQSTIWPPTLPGMGNPSPLCARSTFWWRLRQKSHWAPQLSLYATGYVCCSNLYKYLTFLSFLKLSLCLVGWAFFIIFHSLAKCYEEGKEILVVFIMKLLLHLQRDSAWYVFPYKKS